MITLLKPAVRLLFVLLVLVGSVLGSDSGRETALTHADAAIILAKHSGFFDRYVDGDADLSACVAFLNKTGVYFGLMEVVNGSEFRAEDCARALGQINLVLSGESEFSNGKVKLPKDIESWEEFCIMNDIKYVEGRQTMLEILEIVSAQ